MHIHTYKHTHIYMQICTNAYIYINTYMHTYTHIYIYIYSSRQGDIFATLHQPLRDFSFLIHEANFPQSASFSVRGW